MNLGHTRRRRGRDGIKHRWGGGRLAFHGVDFEKWAARSPVVDLEHGRPTWLDPKQTQNLMM
jgi:hypothetical protein